MADDSPQTLPYIFYWNPFSICSLQVRYTIAISRTTKPSGDPMVVEERQVNIYAGEQLDEAFLCNVNPEGQVPVMSHHAALAQPIRDSLDITLYMAEKYPDLIPAPHKGKILPLLEELHSINYFSLSFTGMQEAISMHLRDPIVKLLESPGISQRYHDALQYKLSVVEKDKVRGLEEAQVKIEEEKARCVLSKLNSFVQEEQGLWMFGRDQPTALDAHAIIFLARLDDVGRANFIPSGLKSYYTMAMGSPEWRSVMEGRRTMITMAQML